MKKRRRYARFDDVAQRRRKRRRFGLLAALLLAVFVAGATYALGNDAGDAPEEETLREVDPPRIEPESAPEEPDTSPAAAAFRTVASGLPDKVDAGSVQGVLRSTLDPTWASVRVTGPDEEGTYVLFVQEEGDSWEVRKAVRADEPENPEYEKVILEEVPKDLVESIYPQGLAAASLDSDASELLADLEEPGPLPTVEAAEISSPEPVMDDVPESERERVEAGLEELQEEVEDYDGVAGVYVRDPDGGYGYGVRPDEVFYSASVIKVPIMAAVYRRIDEGAFSLNDSFATESGDWAAGAGWYQWQPFGTYHTVEEYLEMMMTQSDNVATNALTRIVGGPEYVTAVARSMGATNTVLYQKVSSERAIVTSLDNQTTPRDMATMLDRISTGRAASRESCQDMVDLMGKNNLESWLKEGLPEDTEAGNKAGWLYRVYNDTAIVTDGERPYVVAIMSKSGPEDPQRAKSTIVNLSRAAWQAQGNPEEPPRPKTSEPETPEPETVDSELPEDAEILDAPGTSDSETSDPEAFQ